MPNCFQLTKKNAPSPSTLSSIDEELCQVLGVPVHEEDYVNGWVDNIGYALAMGVPLVGKKTLHDGTEVGLEDCFSKEWLESGDEKVQEIKKIVHAKHTKIVAYLRENYTSTAWATNGRS